MSGITCHCLYCLTLTHVRTIEFCNSYNVFIESIAIRSSCLFIKFEPTLPASVVFPTTKKMLNEQRRWTPIYDADKCFVYMFEIIGLSVCLFLISYSSQHSSDGFNFLFELSFRFNANTFLERLEDSTQLHDVCGGFYWKKLVGFSDLHARQSKSQGIFVLQIWRL